MEKPTHFCMEINKDGTLLCRSLHQKGRLVIGTSRRIITDRYPWSILTLDYLNRTNVEVFLKEHTFSEIYFLGAQSSVGQSFDQPHETFISNTIPILNFLEWIKLHAPNTKFFHASSGEIFCCQTNPSDENTKYNPLSPYAVSKLVATELVKNYRNAYQIFAVNGILFNHESYLRDERFVTGKIICSAIRIKLNLQEKLYLGNVNIARDWGSAEDYVEAMQLMIGSDIRDDFVISTGVKTSLKSFCDVVFSELGLNAENHLELGDQNFRPLDLEESVGNPIKIYQMLGWKAQTPLATLIAKWVEKKWNEYDKS
jgi:GDPmannose 4,6-dehydratase